MNTEREKTKILWQELKRMGNMTDTYYDQSIIDDLSVELNIMGDFEPGLKKISPEMLLMSFFNVLSPLTLMYTDILNLFERCKAHSSEENIEIEFDTKKFGSKKLNILHFSHAKEVMVKIERHYQSIFLSVKSLKYLSELSRIREDYSDPNIQSITFKEWYRNYIDNRDDWPTVELDFINLIGNSPIQKELMQAFNFWELLFSIYKLVPVPRNEWYRFLFGEMSYNYNLEVLKPEIDLFLGSMLENLYYLAENYQQLSSSKQGQAKKILFNFAQSIKTKDSIIEESLSLWKDFLKLPVWRHRYELYSIWIFTQMISLFPEDWITFHIKDGVLSFPFKATRLATLTLYNKTFDFWSELRTEAIVKPVGKSRLKAIQPDYSIVYGNHTDITNTVVAVECKQYKKSNTNNFSKAIIDYAYNRPNALIVLVNYGEINSARVFEALNEALNKRSILFSMCRPETKTANDLSECIQKCIYDHSEVFPLNTDGPAYFSLYWGEEPLDLDLYLKHEQNEVLCYESQNIPDAEYITDVTNGYGPEHIYINKWNSGIYDLWVHNYSETPSLSESGGTILAYFKASNCVLKIECPKVGNSKWWHILQIDATNMTIKVVNEISD